MFLARRIIPVIALLMFLLFLPDATAQAAYSIQVGAFADGASRGNMGVGVEIRTHVSTLGDQDFGAAFWVGSNLQNGSFIQFGYDLATSGNYCMYGYSSGGNSTCSGSFDLVENGDARWFWEYWPDAKVPNYYFAIGPRNSVGQEGAWHLYQIMANVTNGWAFLLDGQTVSKLNYPWTVSRDPVSVVAEEGGNSATASGSLGPVEFRNPSYYARNEWHLVKFLYAISGCGVEKPECDVAIPYGVTVLGPTDIIAGTGQQLRKDGELLSTLPLNNSGASLTSTLITAISQTVLGGLGAAALILVAVLAFNARNKRKIQQQTGIMRAKERNYCMNCGSPLPTVANFCTECGSKIGG